MLRINSGGVYINFRILRGRLFEAFIKLSSTIAITFLEFVLKKIDSYYLQQLLLLELLEYNYN